MQRLVIYLGYVLVATLVSVVISPFGSAPVLLAQHGDEHGGDHGGASSDSVDAWADSGVVSLESMRFTCLQCQARVANMIEAVPGVAEVGKVPASFPPLVIVRFDPDQTSAEAIVQAAKTGLETDPFNPTPVAVTLTSAPVHPPAVLEPIERFAATALWVRPVGGNTLRLDTELFGCGSCLNQVTLELRETAGIVEVRPDSSSGGTSVFVTYDPLAIGPDGVVDIARRHLETGDPTLPTTVTVHVLPE